MIGLLILGQKDIAEGLIKAVEHTFGSRPPAMRGQRPPGSSVPILAALSAQPRPRPEPADLRALTSAVDPTLKALLFGRTRKR